MDISKEIKEATKEKKLVIGTRATVKLLKNNGIRIVILSSNVPESIRNDMERYNKESKSELVNFDGDSIRLGQMCGKPFKMLSLGIKK